MTGRELLAGRYELRGALGSGGMAEVRDGWDTRLDRPVAVKLLHPHLNADPDSRRRFEDEARSAASLAHPNIVAVHDFGLHAGTPFLVMERLPGRTLVDPIAAGPMSAAQVRSVLDDVLGALTAAHSAGVLHRDIKPANILLSATGDSWKVGDFGIAKTGAAAHTATGLIVGTLCYLSPERVTGAPASVADDLYAVGAMGYEALLGQRAFPHDNPAALARAIVDGPQLMPVRAIRTDVDPGLADVIDRAMSRDHRLRFASAQQMRAALAGDATARQHGVASALPPRPVTRVLAQPLPPSMHLAPPPPPPPPPSRTRRFVIAGAMLVAFVIAALALAMDPFPTSAPTETVSTSTTAPPSTSSPPPPPVTTTIPTAAVPVIQQPDVKPPDKKVDDKKDQRGGGNNGNGNGNRN